MLESILEALRQAIATDQVTDQVTDHVRRLLEALGEGDAGAAELMRRLGLTHRPTFRKTYREPALAAGLLERTQPDSPRSPTQRYRLSSQGLAAMRDLKKKRS